MKEVPVQLYVQRWDSSCLYLYTSAKSAYVALINWRKRIRSSLCSSTARASAPSEQTTPRPRCMSIGGLLMASWIRCAWACARDFYFGGKLAGAGTSHRPQSWPSPSRSSSMRKAAAAQMRKEEKQAVAAEHKVKKLSIEAVATD